MRYAPRPFVALLATALMLASWPLPSAARHGGHGAAAHRYGHGHGGVGLFWDGVGIAIGLGAVHQGLSHAQRGDVALAPGVYPTPVPAAPVSAPQPDPVIYPRNGQSAWQTEADRQDCNRWATSQPEAVADAAVFQQLAWACMDKRGYTTR